MGSPIRDKAIVKYQAFLISALLLLCVSNANAVLINVATGGTATASGQYLDHAPSNAIDGDYNNMWNSGSWPIQWIEIDLGAVYQIAQINAFVEQLPTPANTTHEVYLDGALSFTWSGITSDGDILSHNYGSPISAQKVKINTTSSPSWVAWNEIEIIVDVPEPGTVILMALGLAGLGFSRRKAK